jgi:glycosyltransferase involved in cell wall biosynthesis
MKVMYASEGTDRYDELFVSYLLEKGHEVHLFTLLTEADYVTRPWDISQYSRLRNLKGLVIYHRPFMQKNPPLTILLLKTVLRKIQPDVLEGNYLQSYAFYSALTVYHPFVAKVWGSDILLRPRASIIGRLRATISLKCADFVLVDSEVQRRAATALGCAPDKIESFPWCVDLEEFNPSVNGRALRSRLGFVDDDFVVMCNRVHDTKYGLKYLIRAMPAVLANLPRAKFLILGEGSETEKLQRLAVELGTRKSILFVGTVPHSTMPEYISASDLYVSPSLSDGTSSSLLEAMASQKPVIATDIMANREWVENEKSGLLVPPMNPAALAKAIVRLESNPAAAHDFANEALAVVRERANLRENLAKYERILTKACTAH